MRWLALFLATLFVVTQVHLCESTYVLPSGQLCATCPTLRDLETGVTSHDALSLSSVAHGDCHDCCTLQSCDGKDAAKATVSPVSSISALVFADTQTEFVIYEMLLVPHDKGFHLDSTPPTGPPSEISARGPPSVRRQSSSAGRLV